ncbi:MAG: hypothetical protein U0234_20035 [Sandaracinus sp.]
MRGAFVVLGAVFGVACSAAQAQPSSGAAPDPSSVCRSDADCVLHDGCCPGCCSCPTVVTRAQARLAQQACAVATCAAVDCSHRSCRACDPVHPACVGGACVAR